MKIILDVFGGDKAPSEILLGAADALKLDKDIRLILVGKQNVIEDFFVSQPKNYLDRIEIIDAQDMITNDDVPTIAIKQKRESSLVKALDALKQREDAAALVSAGSTGAILTGAVLRVGRLEGIGRPALAPILPTIKGTSVCLIDSGANVDSRPEFLVHFALMGDVYMRTMYGMTSPRVALLSNGVEEKKGNELIKETHKLLKDLKNINFVGNMEARDALSGDYDVIVTDGFAGNVLLKSIEGSVTFVLKSFKRAVKSGMRAKFGALFMKKAFKQLKKDMDYNAMGGAPFLGVQKIMVKSHGSSDRVSICASIFQVHKMIKNDLVNNIKRGLVENAEKSHD